MTWPADEMRDADSALGGLAFADVLTIGNGVCGLFAVAVATGLAGAGLRAGGTLDHHRLVLCAALILAGCVLDVADGIVARRLGSSGLGAALDSMCDVVTFGLAPAVMLVAAHATGPRSWHVLSLLVATSLLVASMVRLARFHTQPAPTAGFRGVPMPVAAGAAIALLALAPPAPIELGGVLLISALMVSAIPYPHQDRRTIPLLALFAAMACICLIGAFPLWPAAVVWLVIVPAIPLVNAASRRGLPDRLLAAPQGELSIPRRYRTLA
jgi:CDP-diacylglycerol---serine O-phosphatidyltransferase